MELKGVIFDMDGTLLDSLSFWNYFFKRLGAKYFNNESFMPTEEVNNNMRTMSFDLAMGYFVNACKIPSTVEEFNGYARAELASFYKEKASVKEGAIELLDYLKGKNAKICLASATGLNEVKFVVNYHGLSKYFDTVLSCQEVGAGKEKPDIYYLAAKTLGASPNELMVVEDSFVALETAKNAGFKTVGIYDDNNFNQERLKAASNVTYVEKGESLAKIIGFIG